MTFSFIPHLFLQQHGQTRDARENCDRNMAVLKLFPGSTPQVVNAVLHAEGLHGVIIETFGSGNAPTESWFINAMKEAISRGIIVLNVTQCKAGAVVMGQYEASCEMERIGIIGGNDITLEAAVTKMMYLLGTYPDDHDHVRHSLQCSLRGEITVNQSRLSYFSTIHTPPSIENLSPHIICTPVALGTDAVCPNPRLPPR